MNNTIIYFKESNPNQDLVVKKMHVRNKEIYFNTLQEDKICNHPTKLFYLVVSRVGAYKEAQRHFAHYSQGYALSGNA